jgi:hypothetical protein
MHINDLLQPGACDGFSLGFWDRLMGNEVNDYKRFSNKTKRHF